MPILANCVFQVDPPSRLQAILPVVKAELAIFHLTTSEYPDTDGVGVTVGLGVIVGVTVGEGVGVVPGDAVIEGVTVGLGVIVGVTVGVLVGVGVGVTVGVGVGLGGMNEAVNPTIVQSISLRLIGCLSDEAQ